MTSIVLLNLKVQALLVTFRLEDTGMRLPHTASDATKRSNENQRTDGKAN